MMDVDLGYTKSKALTALGQVIESIGVEKQGKCRSCGTQVYDRYLLRIDSHNYHEACANCTICKIPLEERCYERAGQLYCKEHYYNKHSPYLCAGCKQGISPADMVYKLGTELIYHVTCHCCQACGRGLAPGEQIVVDEAGKAVFCISHYYAEPAPPEAYPPPPLAIGCESYPSCSAQSDPNLIQLAPLPPPPTVPLPFTAEQFSEFHIKKEIDSLGYGFDGYSFSDFCEEDGKFLKRRGPRTTIKQNQLDVLNRIFTTTPKPSKHARAKLALETGLSMRVIQVWFQNRRSKERRLKHLCNYLRHFEQRGLVPPPFFQAVATAAHSGQEVQPEMFSQFMNNVDANQFDEDSADDQ